jgi:homoserine dehydrogenase
VIGIVTRTRGNMVSPGGVDLARALDSAGPFRAGNPPLTALEAAESLDYDVLVELSTLTIAQRGEPAASHIRAALRRKHHAVTANKGPVAFAYAELAELARAGGVKFLFESTVMDGAPVFSMARASLKGCAIREIAGILSSTTNSILSSMEQGLSPGEALAQAQREGFAEADPNLDLEGWDAAAKVAVLSSVLMGVPLPLEAIEREGITHITPERVRQSWNRGKRLKLICRAWRQGESVRGRVSVEEISPDNPFATVRGSGSAVRIDTDLMGPLYIVQENPTVTDTAYGVVNDLLTIAG